MRRDDLSILFTACPLYFLLLSSWLEDEAAHPLC